MSVTINIDCVSPKCDHRFDSLDHYMELMDYAPGDGAHACIGWLKERSFLEGAYVGGRFGGEVAFTTKDWNSSWATKRRNNLVSNSVEGEDFSFPVPYKGRFAVVRLTPELKERRLEALKERGHGDRRFYEYKLKGPHKNIKEGTLGPLYCAEHAKENDFTCPECYNDLVPADSQAFLMLKNLTREQFMESFMYKFL
jgi:hypothetical protein